MTGIVLCGGQSTRMGTDKALLKLHANTWAQTAADKITVLGLPVVLSVNATQYESYSSVFPASSLIKDNEELAVKGPLCAVLSVHIQKPSEDLFVLACDMPLMESFLLKELINSQNNNNYQAYIYSNDGEPEPLCGIYTAAALSYILNMHISGALKKFSMKNMLEQLSVFSISIPEDQKKYFRNFNAHAELNGL
jgi:molybdenum cofactor guanylyltransferase